MNKAKLSPWMVAGKTDASRRRKYFQMLSMSTSRTLPRKGRCQAWSQRQPRPFPIDQGVHDDK